MNIISKSFSELLHLITGKGLKSELIRSGIGSLTIKFLFIVFNFGTSVALARALGADGYGIYSYAIAIIFLLSVIAKFGLHNLIVRETAKYLAKKSWGYIQGVWRWSVTFSAILTIITLIGAGLYILVQKNSFSLQQREIMIYGMALLPVMAMNSLFSGALRGLNRIIAGQMQEQVLLPGFFLLLIFIGILFYPEKELSPSLAIELRVIAALLAFGIGIWLLWYYTPKAIRSAKPYYKGREWLASAIPFAFNNILTMINARIGIILLGIFMLPADVGIYRVAFQSAVLVVISLQAVNMVVAPQFARLYTLGEKARLQQLVTASATIVLLFTLPVALVFLLFGRQILLIVFGAEYIPAYTALFIMVLGQLVNASMGSVQFLLNMTGYEKDTARSLLIAVTSSILLNLILIPVWGVNGAALTTTLSLILWNVLLWRIVRKRLQINSLAFNIFPIKHVSSSD